MSPLRLGKQISSTENLNEIKKWENFFSFKFFIHKMSSISRIVLENLRSPLCSQNFWRDSQCHKTHKKGYVAFFYHPFGCRKSKYPEKKTLWWYQKFITLWWTTTKVSKTMVAKGGTLWKQPRLVSTEVGRPGKILWELDLSMWVGHFLFHKKRQLKIATECT